jgi:hypothetical protein
MPKSDTSEALVYYSEKGPDVPELCKAYEETISNLSDYFSQCRNSYNERRNEWPGKQDDLRKGGANAFPWKGASDTEAHVISERIDTYVALCMTALTRANIRAYPVEAGDMAQAKVVSSFLKWMVTHYVPRFQQEMEQAANHLFERGLMVTYVGWERHESSYLQSITLQEIADASPDLARLILEGTNDDQIVALLQGIYNNLTTKRGKKALNQLRKKGAAEIPVTRRKIDRPCVKACAPDGEVFFPPYCMDPQRAPYVFYKTLMTAQELESKVVSEGWDRDWVEYVIENCKGAQMYEMGNGNTMARRDIVGIERPEDLYEIVRGYQRLIDLEDGGQGIYCTVFHPNYSGAKPDVPAYAKFELLNGFEDYPFIVTRLAEDDKRMYDVITVPEKLRGLQWQVKVERDSRVDRNGLATVPPLLHPVGKPPTGEWAPGGKIGRTRREDFEFAPVPQFNPGSVEMEQTMLHAADKIMGLDVENPLATAKRQFYLDKFLAHIRDVIKAAFQAFQRFGPDEVFFTVTGVADPQKFQKGSADEDFNLIISFDVQNFDPEADDKGVEQFLQILPYDKNGRINIDTLVEALAYRIDPVLADAMLQPIEVAQQKVVKDVTDDLTKISSAIEVGARPNGAQIALQLVQQYASQPDVAQRLQQDQAFAQRLQKYAEQYQMQIVQAQNAEIGRLGTAPASMGAATTQTANTVN